MAERRRLCSNPRMPAFPSESEIRRQLEAFAERHGNDAALVHMRDLLAGSPTPCARDHFAPGHFTASACVLSPSGDQVLLVHHAKLDRWLQPGGHIEADDTTLLDAARREVAEECGLAGERLLAVADFPVDLDVHAIPARREDPEHLHFDIRYGFVADPATPVVRSDESLAVRWFETGDLERIGVDASARRMIERCRQTLLR